MMSTDIFVTPKGNVSWLASAIFQSSCEIRVQYFPFDDQECMINFTSWSHNGGEINLILLTEEGDLSSYHNNSELSLTAMSAKRFWKHKPCCPDKNWPMISIRIFLSRKPFFYVFNHIMPGALISSMALTGFLIPPDSGEKVTMCITTMLSMGVYLKTITEIIPPTSEAIPLVGMYYVVSLAMVCCITMLNIWTLNLHGCSSRGHGHPIPDWTRTWILGHMASLLRMKIPVLGQPKILREAKVKKARKSSWQAKRQFRKYSTDPGSDQYLSPNSTLPSQKPQMTHMFKCLNQENMDKKFAPIVDEIEKTFQRVLDRVWRSLRRNELRQEICDERSDIIWEWKAIALIIDRFLLLIFFLATCITSILIFIQPAFIK